MQLADVRVSERPLFSERDRWEVRGHLRRLVRRIRRHWPATHITIRGDGHYSRPQVMAWCEENGIDFIFGLPGNAVLTDAVEETADDIRTRRALDHKPCLRGFAETRYQAQSWNKQRRACARIEATTRGLDIRFLVTSLETGSAERPHRAGGRGRSRRWRDRQATQAERPRR